MKPKGQGQIAAIAISILVFLIVLTVYGQVWSVYNGVVNANVNAPIFSSGVQALVNLIPLVLVGAAIIGIVIVAFRMSQ